MKSKREITIIYLCDRTIDLTETTKEETHVSITVDRAFVKAALPVRDPEAHKGRFGRVRILAGSVGYTGAPAFAAEAAVRTGSGLVFLSVPREI